jgi:GDP-4-dehydro-6-deoxy-D-mannose reductase
MPVNVLITGITGFAGSYLAKQLVESSSARVVGLKRWNSPLDNIQPILGSIELIDGDLRDSHSIYRAVAEAAPDVVYHLAAQSYVPISFHTPAETINTNAAGTVALLEAIRRAGLDPVIDICTSSEVYGDVPEEELPITESTVFRPQSPYAVSKVAQDMLGYQYHVSYGMRIIRTRSFTNTGPRSKEFVVLPAFAKQIAEIELGIRPDNLLRVGNLDSVRTFCDIRDMVRAYQLVIDKCVPGEVYNIVGAHVCTVGEMLSSLLALSDAEPEIYVDPRLLRPSDVTRQIADGSKFNNVTGWNPEIPFAQTLQDTLDYWRQEVRRRGSI